MTGQATLPEVPPIDVADIRATQPVVPAPDGKADKEQHEFDHEYRTQKAELGWIGAILGSKSEKPGNVSSLVIGLCFLFLFFAFQKLDMATFDEYFMKLLSAVLGVVGLALGYLFGSSDRK